MALFPRARLNSPIEVSAGEWTLLFPTLAMNHVTLLRSILLLLAFCIHADAAGGIAGVPQAIKVSAYDPKEKQRSGMSYSEHAVSALWENGASRLIARAGKGGNLDEKCGSLLASADRAGLLPGVYCRLHVETVAQADRFIPRSHFLARSHNRSLDECIIVAAVRGFRCEVAYVRHPGPHGSGRKPRRCRAGRVSGK